MNTEAATIDFPSIVFTGSLSFASNFKAPAAPVPPGSLRSILLS
ncbi:hypothetical protein VXQ18_02205 [Brucella abortus]|nr:hypothetical protein [Brucella abortus]